MSDSDPSNTPRTVSFLGVPVHAVTVAQTLALIDGFIAEGKPRQICTVNPEFVMRAQADAAFHDLLMRADLNVADGVGLLWAARRLGSYLPERVPGSSMVEWIAERAAQRGWRVFLLGAAPGGAERAARRLQERYAGLQIAGTYAGSPRPEEAPEIIDRIRSARVDVLLVAFGAPAQDEWIDRYKSTLGVPVSMGVGGAFDFLAGTAVRAPGWMQRLGLEWLHRLWRQPWRWKRIWVAVVVFPVTLIGQQRRRRAP